MKKKKIKDLLIINLITAILLFISACLMFSTNKLASFLFFISAVLNLIVVYFRIKTLKKLKNNNDN